LQSAPTCVPDPARSLAPLPLLLRRSDRSERSSPARVHSRLAHELSPAVLGSAGRGGGPFHHTRQRPSAPAMPVVLRSGPLFLACCSPLCVERGCHYDKL